MITIALSGGLGNQMFQFVTGYALARRHGVDLTLDRFLLDRDQHRSYALDRWKLSADSITAVRVRSGGSRFPFAYRVARRLSWLFHRTEHIASYRSGYDSAVDGCGASAYLEGYFQSWRYFDQYHDEVCNLFTPRLPLSDQSLAVLDRIRQAESVSVHVRRGDYVSNRRTSLMHGACDVEYYQRAIQHITRRQSRVEFFVFSDEASWAAQNLEFEGPTTVVSRTRPADVHEDMVLMQACKHNIIANSTYSWWSAYLNANRSKIVVAPNRWFAGSTDPGSDLVPIDWVRL